MSSRIRVLFSDFLFIYATAVLFVLGLFIAKYPNTTDDTSFWKDYPKTITGLILVIDSFLVGYVLLVGLLNVPQGFIFALGILVILTLTWLIAFAILGFMVGALSKTPTENNQATD